MKPFHRKIRYTQIPAGETDPKNVLSILYTNRARTNRFLKNIRQSVMDSTQALYCNIHNTSAFIERGLSLLEMDNYRNAFNDFSEASKLSPKSSYIRGRISFAEERILQQTLLETIQEEWYQTSNPNTYSTLVEEYEPKPELRKVEFVDKTFDFNNFTPQNALEITNILKSKKLPTPDTVTSLLMKMRDVLKELPNVVFIDTEIPKRSFKIVGDVHGQFSDLIYIFETFGYPTNDSPYLFNGDFVDRGSEGLEIILVLFAWKIAAPDSIYLNRGNHECSYKLGQNMFTMFSAIFEYLPLAHIIGSKVFIVHGGLTAKNITIEDIQSLNRVCQPPEDGILNDLLWSDPHDSNGCLPSPRGGTILFGPDITTKFLETNNLELIIRSHQVVDDGYLVQHNGQCVTIFSAPNYIGRAGNQGAIVLLSFLEDGSLSPLKFQQFSSQPVSEDYPPMVFTDFY